MKPVAKIRHHLLEVFCFLLWLLSYDLTAQVTDDRNQDTETEVEHLEPLSRKYPFSELAIAGEVEALEQSLALYKERFLDSLLLPSKVEDDWEDKLVKLPENSCFIDFLRYRKTSGDSTKIIYGAVISIDGKMPQFVELGTEAILLRWLRAVDERLNYRANLNGNREVEPPLLRLQAALEQIHLLFLAPVIAVIPDDVQRLIISLDGSLRLAPFSCLLDEDNSFFCDTFPEVFFVSSRRDLGISVSSEGLSAGRWDLIEAKLQDEELRRLTELETDFPISEKLESLRAISPSGSRVFMSSDDIQAALAAIPSSPQLLHFDDSVVFEKTTLRGTRNKNVIGFPEILSSSGFMVGGFADGKLSPSEIPNLDLSQTQLVTLSSCDFMLSDPIAAEELICLQRAFLNAGARQVLVDLWQKPNSPNSDFIARFYRASRNSKALGQSLWALQRRMLTREVKISDEAKLEEAVLHYGGLTIIRQGPLPTVSTPVEVGEEDSGRFLRRYSLWIFTFGICLVLLLIFAGKYRMED